MEQDTKYALLGVALCTGLIVGGVSGYFYGSYSATRSINEQIAAEEKANDGSARNPFQDVETNPLKDVTTNPYENVKLNPFD